ncbi:MAG: hypothetical protein AB4038_16240 [Prochloraceae cyanobacterium]
MFLSKQKSNLINSSDVVLIWTLRSLGAIAAAIVLLIVIFLIVEASPILLKVGIFPFFSSSSWHPAEGLYNLTPMLWGTLFATIGSVLVATPLGILSAIFCQYYAPARIAYLYRRLI